MAQGNTYADGIVPLTDKNINWSGRWVDLDDGSKQASFESYVEIKFTGTSLQINIDKSWAYVQIDGGEVKTKNFTKNSFSSVAKVLFFLAFLKAFETSSLPQTLTSLP